MKKNVNLFIKILLILFLFIPIIIMSIKSELIIGDEIWNFQNIMKMLNNGKIYIDANVIITPIFYEIGKVIVKIFGANILGFRIYNSIIFLLLIVTTFSIFEELKKDTLKNIFYSLIVLLFVFPYISVGANYNVLAIVFYLSGILLFLNREKIKYYNIFQGIVIYLVLFTKQNIGVFYILALSIATIYAHKKESVHYLIREVMIASLLSLATVVIMLIQGNFIGFLNYAFFGMSEFTNNLKLAENVEILIVFYGLIAISTYILIFVLNKKDKCSNKNIIILSIFAMLLNLTAYPIFNLYHSSFAILINIIILIYICEESLLKKVEKSKIKIAMIIVIYIIIHILCINCGLKASKNIQITDKESVYFSANIDKELNNNLKQITDYIVQKEKEGKKVICISSDAALYMTYLNKNNKEIDLIFEGNLGYNGKNKIIQKLENLENTIILMNRKPYWQEIREVRSYVIQNYNYINIIGDCYIYE